MRFGFFSNTVGQQREVLNRNTVNIILTTYLIIASNIFYVHWNKVDFENNLSFVFRVLSKAIEVQLFIFFHSAMKMTTIVILIVRSRIFV